MSSIGLIVTILRGKGKMKRLFMVCETMQYIGIVVLSCFSALLLLGSGKRMIVADFRLFQIESTKALNEFIIAD